MLVISQQLAQQPKTPMFSLVTELVQRSQVKTQALSKNLDNRRHILSQRQPVWRREIQKPKRNNTEDRSNLHMRKQLHLHPRQQQKPPPAQRKRPQHQSR
jgi:hypothetical protein